MFGPKSLLGLVIIAAVVITAILAIDHIYSQSLIKKQLPPVPTQAPLAQPITIAGEMVCLPHKETDGPQSLECAFGLKDDAGKYYSLRDSDPQYKHLTTGTGKRVEIVGTFTPQDGGNYQSVGIIEIQTLKQL